MAFTPIRTIATAAVFLLTSHLAEAKTLNFKQFLESHPTQLESIASDTEAFSVFVSELGATLGLTQDLKPTKGKASDSFMPSPVKDETIQLIAELVTWRLAIAIQHAMQNGELTALHALLDRVAPQMDWLLEKRTIPHLVKTRSLATTILHLSELQAPLQQQLPHYDTFADYIERTYPYVTESKTSWVVVAEEQGAAGILERLQKFWADNPSVSSNANETNSSEQRAYAGQYIQTRLTPVLKAHLFAYTIQLQAEAEQQARKIWQSLREGQEAFQETKARARICGKWQWIVHNHQNHQDHKMIMAFPHPHAGQPAHPTPSKVVVLGNTVYLRWDFPGGYQEDSLLLSKRDTLLEGTFVNSAGPNGTITGRRMTACEPNESAYAR